MDNYYEKEMLLTSAFIDRNCRLGLYQVGMILQDVMTELFYQFGCDGVVVARDYSALWAFARFKFHMERCPVWMDRVRVRIFPVRVSPVTVHLNTEMETLTGETVLRCRQELCALDLRDHSLRKLVSLPYPMELPLCPPVYTAPYRRMKTVFSKENFVYEETIYPLDTDMNRHMNNVAYLRAVVNAFPAAFWDSHRIMDFDIHYLSEGREGDRVRVFLRDLGDDFAVQVESGERILVRAFLKTEDIPEDSAQ